MRMPLKLTLFVVFAGVVAMPLLKENELASANKTPGSSATTKAGLKYQPIGKGIRWLVKKDAFLKTLVERENYGNADIEVAELYLPKIPKSEQVVQGLEHVHKSTEIFYVISGKLGHTVNGKKYVIEPGQVGIVHAGEKIIHSVEGDEPVKAIVIWVPGGEANNLKYNMGFKEQPIDGLLND